MIRPVLLGGKPPRMSTLKGWLVNTWLPVVIMLVAIAIESTHAFSSDNTSGWMRAVYQVFAGPVSNDAWARVHHIVRKTGHFTGYGLMGLAWTRAWLILWRQPLRHQPTRVWRGYSLCMAILCTALVAALDEFHQSYMADRTGTVADVLLDTTGAIVLLGLCLAVSFIPRRDG